MGALLNGAALVIITKDTLLDAKRLEDTLQQYAVSYMFMTTSLFNFIAPQCPSAFRSLNYLLVGGSLQPTGAEVTVANSMAQKSA